MLDRRRGAPLSRSLLVWLCLVLGGGCQPRPDSAGPSVAESRVSGSQPVWFGPSGPSPTGSVPTAATVPAPAPETPVMPAPVAGYTDFKRSADTRVVYVSSKGSDANDGLSPERPVATVARGLAQLRDGFPDHLLFKRGDVFKSGFGIWTLSGRSAREPMVIGAYGTGERPRFEFEDTAIITHGGSGIERTDNLAFVSLHFLGAANDPHNKPRVGTPRCILWLRPARDVAFEDVRFEYCSVGLQSEVLNGIERWRFYRSLFLDVFNATGGHASGLYLSKVKAVSVEECIFDLCGWHPDVPSAQPTMFNHCIYWQKQSATDGLVRGNIIMRGSSHGVQMRSSGRVEGNVFVRNAIGGFLADDTQVGPVNGVAVNNVFSEAEDITPREKHAGTEHRGWGFELIVNGGNPKYSFVLKDNIFSTCRAANPSGCRTAPASLPRAEIANNLVWHWATSRENELTESKGPFPDPDRTVASYNASLGGKNDFAAFASEVRKQSKTNWRKQYGAEAVIAYFRSGFGLKNQTNPAKESIAK